jgi:pSer/pThr/pTyr-binding forkhead associated (FHA) protein
MRLLLSLINGDEIEYEMEKDSISIGRSNKCDLVIPHEGMSRQHCKIEIINGEVFITDLGSINGVFIDGKKIAANSSIPFQTYLHLSFGAVSSAQLIVDEVTRLGTSGIASETKSSATTTSGGSSSKAKIKPIKSPAPETTKSKPKKPGVFAKNPGTFMLLGFIASMLTIYFLLHAGDEQDPVTTPEAQQSAPKQPTSSGDHF